MLAIPLSILLGILQAAQTGTVVGVVKLPGSDRPLQGAHIVLLPPKYTEVWNKQVQQRLDNYWEIYKPEFAAHKERFLDFERAAQIESYRYVTATMRRELGLGASRLMQDSSANGQFELSSLPFGTYQLLVETTANGQDVIWSKTLEVQTDVPIFVDLGKPVS